MKKAAWSVLSQQASSHVRSRVHSRFMLKRVGSVFPVSLTGLRGYWGSLGGVKANAMGLDVKNLMGSPKHGRIVSLGFL